MTTQPDIARSLDLPIKDAKNDITFRVTAKDSERGNPSDDHACAIALALGRRADVYGISVGPCVVYVRRGRFIERFVHSARSKQAIDKFDGNYWFPPGMYTLKAPPPSKSKGYRAGQSGTNVRGGGTSSVRTRAYTQPSRRVSTP